MSCFVGRMHEYERISLDRFDGKNLQSTVYILSHLHEDHTVGLAAPGFWNRLKTNKDIFVYCSEVTEVLIEASVKYKHLVPYIKSLQINCPTTIAIPDPLYDEKEVVTVTFLPAFHCPGSVMCLFEGHEGTALYTGDFRWEHFQLEQMHHLRSGESVKQIKSLYIDTTFFNTNTLYIPSRQHCIDAVYQLVREWTQQSPDHVVYISLRAQYGHEPLLNGVATRLNKKIHVSDHKLAVYDHISEFSGNFTADGSSTQIHACGREVTVVSEGVSIPCFHRHPRDKVLVILPTTMYFTQLPHLTLDKIVRRINDGFYRACYSFHSAYTEIQDLLSYLKPTKVYPNVIAVGDSSLAVTQHRLNALLKECISKAESDRQAITESGDAGNKLGKLKRGQKTTTKRKDTVSDSDSLDFGTPVKSRRLNVSQSDVEQGTSSVGRRGRGRGVGRGRKSLSQTSEDKSPQPTRTSTRLRTRKSAVTSPPDDVDIFPQSTTKKRKMTASPELFGTPVKSDIDTHSSYAGSVHSDSEMDLTCSQQSVEFGTSGEEIPTAESSAVWRGSFLAAVSSSLSDEALSSVCIIDNDVDQIDRGFEDVSQIVQDDEDNENVCMKVVPTDVNTPVVTKANEIDTYESGKTEDRCVCCTTKADDTINVEDKTNKNDIEELENDTKTSEQDCDVKSKPKGRKANKRKANKSKPCKSSDNNVLDQTTSNHKNDTKSEQSDANVDHTRKVGKPSSDMDEICANTQKDDSCYPEATVQDSPTFRRSGRQRKSNSKFADSVLCPTKPAKHINEDVPVKDCISNSKADNTGSDITSKTAPMGTLLVKKQVTAQTTIASVSGELENAKSNSEDNCLESPKAVISDMVSIETVAGSKSADVNCEGLTDGNKTSPPFTEKQSMVTETCVPDTHTRHKPLDDGASQKSGSRKVTESNQTSMSLSSNNNEDSLHSTQGACTGISDGMIQSTELTKDINQEKEEVTNTFKESTKITGNDSDISDSISRAIAARFHLTRTVSADGSSTPRSSQASNKSTREKMVAAVKDGGQNDSGRDEVMSRSVESTDVVHSDESSNIASINDHDDDVVYVGIEDKEKTTASPVTNLQESECGDCSSPRGSNQRCISICADDPAVDASNDQGSFEETQPYNWESDKVQINDSEKSPDTDNSDGESSGNISSEHHSDIDSDCEILDIQPEKIEIDLTEPFDAESGKDLLENMSEPDSHRTGVTKVRFIRRSSFDLFEGHPDDSAGDPVFNTSQNSSPNKYVPEEIDWIKYFEEEKEKEITTEYEKFISQISDKDSSDKNTLTVQEDDDCIITYCDLKIKKESLDIHNEGVTKANTNDDNKEIEKIENTTSSGKPEGKRLLTISFGKPNSKGKRPAYKTFNEIIEIDLENESLITDSEKAKTSSSVESCEEYNADKSHLEKDTGLPETVIIPSQPPEMHDGHVSKDASVESKQNLSTGENSCETNAVNFSHLSVEAVVSSGNSDQYNAERPEVTDASDETIDPHTTNSLDDLDIINTDHIQGLGKITDTEAIIFDSSQSRSSGDDQYNAERPEDTDASDETIDPHTTNSLDDLDIINTDHIQGPGKITDTEAIVLDSSQSQSSGDDNTEIVTHSPQEKSVNVITTDRTIGETSNTGKSCNQSEMEGNVSPVKKVDTTCVECIESSNEEDSSTESRCVFLIDGNNEHQCKRQNCICKEAGNPSNWASELESVVCAVSSIQSKIQKSNSTEDKDINMKIPKEPDIVDCDSNNLQNSTVVAVGESEMQIEDANTDEVIVCDSESPDGIKTNSAEKCDSPASILYEDAYISLSDSDSEMEVDLDDIPFLGDKGRKKEKIKDMKKSCNDNSKNPKNLTGSTKANSQVAVDKTVEQIEGSATSKNDRSINEKPVLIVDTASMPPNHEKKTLTKENIILQHLSDAMRQDEKVLYRASQSKSRADRIKQSIDVLKKGKQDVTVASVMGESKVFYLQVERRKNPVIKKKNSENINKPNTSTHSGFTANKFSKVKAAIPPPSSAFHCKNIPQPAHSHLKVSRVRPSRFTDSTARTSDFTSPPQVWPNFNIPPPTFTSAQTTGTSLADTCIANIFTVPPPPLLSVTAQPSSSHTSAGESAVGEVQQLPVTYPDNRVHGEDPYYEGSRPSQQEQKHYKAHSRPPSHRFEDDDRFPQSSPYDSEEPYDRAPRRRDDMYRKAPDRDISDAYYRPRHPSGSEEHRLKPPFRHSSDEHHSHRYNDPHDSDLDGHDSYLERRDHLDRRDPYLDRRDPDLDPHLNRHDPYRDPYDPYLDQHDPNSDRGDRYFDRRDPYFDRRDPDLDRRDPCREPHDHYLDPHDPHLETRDPYADQYFDRRDPYLHQRELSPDYRYDHDDPVLHHRRRHLDIEKNPRPSSYIDPAQEVLVPGRPPHLPQSHNTHASRPPPPPHQAPRHVLHNHKSSCSVYPGGFQEHPEDSQSRQSSTCPENDPALVALQTTLQSLQSKVKPSLSAAFHKPPTPGNYIIKRSSPLFVVSRSKIIAGTMNDLEPQVSKMITPYSGPSDKTSFTKSKTMTNSPAFVTGLTAYKIKNSTKKTQ